MTKRSGGRDEEHWSKALQVDSGDDKETSSIATAHKTDTKYNCKQNPFECEVFN